MFHVFQSTPSVGRETCYYSFAVSVIVFQSTPSVGRETQVLFLCMPPQKLFQSTPSVGRETYNKGRKRLHNHDFNPLPPWGGRQGGENMANLKKAISIHSLRGEGDRQKKRYEKEKAKNFNPLPPWGGRPVSHNRKKRPESYFNPLPPWGGRRLMWVCSGHWSAISIHSLRGEGDETNIYMTSDGTEFQSTPSVGRETAFLVSR